MRIAPTATVALAVLLIAGGLSAAVADSARAKTPYCFGAAARDPDDPCVNRKLDYTVRPTPRVALLESVAPCAPVRGANPGVCGFGLSARRAGARVAVLGDSHAVHWRPALARAALANRWRGLSITRPNCPFTMARTPGKGRCGGWARSVVRYLKRHREVHTVFVSANSGSGVVAPRGQYNKTKIDGYVRAWRALPSSVREVFVIRDVPHSVRGTRRCVERAVARGRKPGVRCARRRSLALGPDLQITAAKRAGAARVSVIDLTPFMCDERRCFPVVGGALVIKDIGHLTRTFSLSLGRGLARSVMRLRAAPARRRGIRRSTPL